MTGFVTTPVCVCWELAAPPGPRLDALIATMLLAGVLVEPIRPAEGRYRLTGSSSVFEKLASALAEGEEGWSLAVEQPPTDMIRFTSKLAPATPYRRTIFVHGVGDAFRQVRLAVDAHLTVSSVGIHRYAVTGRTADLVTWAATAWGRSTDEIRTLWNMTPDSVEAEDRALGVNLSVPLSINLPDRVTTSSIVRDATGDIVKISQKTVDA